MHYHLKRHADDLPFACKTCDYKCQFQQTLDNHKAAKHPESAEAKKAVMYKCPMDGCAFQTLTQGNRVIHFIRKHCKAEVDQILHENSLSCKICKKTFQSNTSFHYHAASCITLKNTTLITHLLSIKH